MIWDGEFDGRFDEREHAVARFRAHAESVRATLPAERLLVFDVRDGWAPLCAFLDAAVPADLPFPHVNDRRRVRLYVRLLESARVIVPGLAVSTGLLALLFLASCS